MDLEQCKWIPMTDKIGRMIDPDEWRWYVHPEDVTNPSKWMPAFSTILSLIVPMRLKQYFINNDAAAQSKTRRTTADMGNLLHQLIEDSLMGKGSDVPEECADAMAAWFDLRRKHNITAQAVELPVWSDVWGFGGTLDILGTFDGRPFIGDLKTGRYDIKAGWQMTAYARAYHEMTGQEVSIVGLSVHRDGREARAFQYEHLDWCWSCFLAALQVFKGVYYGKLERMEWKWLHDGFFERNTETIETLWESVAQRDERIQTLEAQVDNLTAERDAVLTQMDESGVI